MAALRLAVRRAHTSITSARVFAASASLVDRHARRSYHAPLKEMDFIVNENYDFQKHYAKLEHQNGQQIFTHIDSESFKTQSTTHVFKHILVLGLTRIYFLPMSFADLVS